MSVDGVWTVAMKTPLGRQEATLSLVTNGGELSGAFESRLGAGPIANGHVEGDDIAWSTQLQFPLPLTAVFTAKVVGDRMTGSVMLGRLGQAPFDGARTS